MMRNALPVRTLGPRPDLDQLKRQAKELLAAFRAGDPAAVTEIRNFFPDEGPKDIGLSEAQLVLARSYGFASWPKLKEHVDGTTVERLVEAVKNGDAARVRAMLKARPELVNMDLAERDEHRALHFAVLKRDAAMTRLLMEHGANARIGIYPHRDATSALTIATERGYDEIAGIIREVEQRQPTAPRQPTATGQPTAVGHATAAGQQPTRVRAALRSDALRKLIEQRDEVGAIAHLSDDASLKQDGGWINSELEGGLTLLHVAMEGNMAQLASWLLEHGADPNRPTDSGWPSPMFVAYRERNAPMMKLLAQHGGIVDAAIAGYHRDTARARELLELEKAGTLPARAVRRGKTVAEELLDGDVGDPEIVRMALDRLDWPRDDARWYRVLKGPIAFWNHIPWIASDKWPLVRSGYLASFRLILARCHANVGGSFGRVILHDVVVMGLRAGVRDWISEGETCEFVEALLDAGARLDVRDELLRSTPLGWACRWGRAKVVRLLIERGADPVEADAEPWATPRAWAEKKQHERVLQVLRLPLPLPLQPPGD